MIDWNRLAELRSEVGQDGFAEIVPLFLAEVEDVLAGLGELHDPQSLAQACHFLKGSALNLGFADFAEICAQGEVEPADLCVFTLRQVYQASRQALERGQTAEVLS